MQKTATPGFRSLTSRINFDAFRTPEHADWRAHREAYRSVPRRQAGFRGGIGLGLLIDHTALDGCPSWGGTTLVPDDAVRWLTVVDIPDAHMRTDHPSRSHVHWATVRRTAAQFGMPQLAFGNEDACFDLLAFPFSDTTVRGDFGDVVVRPPVNTLDSARDVQLFRAFNAIQWGLTSAAAAYCPDWRPARPAVAKHLGLRRYPEGTAVVMCGGDVYNGVEDPDAWMPLAYLGFAEASRDHLYDAAGGRPRPAPGVRGPVRRGRRLGRAGDARRRRRPRSPPRRRPR